MNTSFDPADLAYCSATEQLRQLNSRRIGAVELLDLHLSRIERLNPQLGAVVALDIERAHDAARQADAVADGRGALHGLSLTVKDSFEVAGMPTTCGLPFLAAHRPSTDAAAVARLKSAGAIVFGKTNLPPGAGDFQSANELFGAARNPWDETKTPGGSSGGAAAAVAAGLSSLELGSDIAGSVRVPAHFCGVYGHKPSYGLIPIAGHVPPFPGSPVPIEMGVAGPLTRSADDLELMMDVLVSASPSAAKAWSVAIPASRHERLEDFRVAVLIDDAYAVDDADREQLLSYVDDLRRIGVKVDWGAKPDFDMKQSFETFLASLNAIFAALGPYEAAEAGLAAARERAATGDAYAEILTRSALMRHREFVALAMHREKLMTAWARFFEAYDLLLCPVSTTAAFAHDQSYAHLGLAGHTFRTIHHAGRDRPYADTFLWSSLASVADLPATAMPTGRFVNGLPVGLQVIGPVFEDRTPIRFAQLVEKQLGGFVRPPLAPD